MEKGEVETPRSVAGNRSEKHDRTVSGLIQYDPSKFKLVPIASESPYNIPELKEIDREMKNLIDSMPEDTILKPRVRPLNYTRKTLDPDI